MRHRTRAPHGSRPGTTLEHKPEQYGGHAIHDQSRANDNRFVACPVKAEGRTEVRRPPAPRGPRPHLRGGRHTGRPPLLTPPALERPGRAGPPKEEHTTPSQARGEQDRAAPHPTKRAKQGTGPRQDTRRGTDCVERPYQRPAPEPRGARAPRRPREEGGGRTPRESERRHTQGAHGEYQKGNRTEPAERTDRMERRTRERG